MKKIKKIITEIGLMILAVIFGFLGGILSFPFLIIRIGWAMSGEMFDKLFGE